MNNNFSNKSIPKNAAINTNAINPNANKLNKTMEWDINNIIVVFAMLLIACGLIPLIVRVAKTQSAKDISYATPILFIIAFFLLLIVSAFKKIYAAFFIFLIGLIASIILLIQKYMHDKNTSHRESREDREIDNYNTKFKFPDPSLDGIQNAKFKPKKN